MLILFDHGTPGPASLISFRSHYQTDTRRGMGQI